MSSEHSDYDIFISYRRESATDTASRIKNELTRKGYKVFLDLEELRSSGKFNVKLYGVIDGVKDFILILSPGALDHCTKEDEEDWVRNETFHALQQNKNIIPFIFSNFNWPNPMPKGFEELPNYNGVKYYFEYFNPAIDNLVKKLESSSNNKDETQQIIEPPPAATSVSSLSGEQPTDGNLQPSDSRWNEPPPAAKSSSGLLFKIVCVSIFVLVLALAGGLLAWFLSRVPAKSLADTFHKWNWHEIEAAYLGKWRDEAGGKYRKLKVELMAAVDNAEKMREAFDSIDKADPVRECQGEAGMPPWRNELKAKLEAKLEADYAPEEGPGEIRLGKEEKLYARLTFCRLKFPESEKVRPDAVLKRYFLPYLQEAVREYGDDRYFKSVRKHLKQFAGTGEIRRESMKEVLKPVLSRLLYEIKTESTHVNTDPETGRPGKESAKILKYHEYFRSLQDLSKSFGEKIGELETLFAEYDETSETRNSTLKKYVSDAAGKAEKSNGADLADWNYCANSWLEQFLSELPAADFVIWQYGHTPKSPTEPKIGKHGRQYLAMLERQSSNPDACYYMGKIYEQLKVPRHAREFYQKAAALYKAGRKYKYLRGSREKYIICLHRIAAMNDESPLRQWEAWAGLDSENKLTMDETLQMARACLGRQGEEQRMIRLYKKLPESMLTRKDHYAFLNKSKDHEEKLKCFEKLVRLAAKDNSYSDLPHFYQVGSGLKSRQADNLMLPILEKAVRQEIPAAVKPYVETLIRLNRDLTDEKVIAFLSRDSQTAEVCQAQMKPAGISMGRLTFSGEQENIYRLWIRTVPMEEEQLFRLCRSWKNNFGRKTGRLLLDRLEIAVQKKFVKIYGDYLRLAIGQNAVFPKNVAEILLESPAVDIRDRIRLAKLLNNGRYAGLCKKALEEGVKLTPAEIEEAWTNAVQTEKWESALFFWGKLEPSRRNESASIREYLKIIINSGDLSNENIEFIFEKLRQDNALIVDFDSLMKLCSFLETRKNYAAEFLLLELSVQKCDRIKTPGYKKYCGAVCHKLYKLLKSGNQIMAVRSGRQKYSFQKKAEDEWFRAVRNQDWPKYFKAAALEYELKDAVLELAGQGFDAEGPFSSLAEANKKRLKAILRSLRTACTEEERGKINDILNNW